MSNHLEELVKSYGEATQRNLAVINDKLNVLLDDLKDRIELEKEIDIKE